MGNSEKIDQIKVDISLITQSVKQLLQHRKETNQYILDIMNTISEQSRVSQFMMELIEQQEQDLVEISKRLDTHWKAITYEN
jgi:hypothetical protein